MEKGITSKLKYSWTGPHTVARVIGPVTYVLMDRDQKLLPGTYHARKMHKAEKA